MAEKSVSNINEAKGIRKARASVSWHGGAVRGSESRGGKGGVGNERKAGKSHWERREWMVLCARSLTLIHGSFGGVYMHAEVSGTRSCIAKLYHTVFKVTDGYVC